MSTISIPCLIYVLRGSGGGFASESSPFAFQTPTIRVGEWSHRSARRGGDQRDLNTPSSLRAMQLLQPLVVEPRDGSRPW